MGLCIPSAYRFDQATPATTWTTVHNLGGNGSQGVPIVDVSVNNNGGIEKMVGGNITIIDKNTVQLVFQAPRSGFAVVIA
jgi:hypothetical protein